MKVETKLKSCDESVIDAEYDDNTKIHYDTNNGESYDQCSPNIKRETWANGKEYDVAYDEHSKRPCSAREVNSPHKFLSLKESHHYNDYKNDPYLN